MQNNGSWAYTTYWFLNPYNILVVEPTHQIGDLWLLNLRNRLLVEPLQQIGLIKPEQQLIAEPVQQIAYFDLWMCILAIEPVQQIANRDLCMCILVIEPLQQITYCKWTYMYLYVVY